MKLFCNKSREKHDKANGKPTQFDTLIVSKKNRNTKEDKGRTMVLAI